MQKIQRRQSAACTTLSYAFYAYFRYGKPFADKQLATIPFPISHASSLATTKQINNLQYTQYKMVTVKKLTISTSVI
jgi:hypothetical protein